MNIDFCLAANEPWTRYRTMVDILKMAEDAPEVLVARAEMVCHPAVQKLIVAAATWGEQPLKRHNDASHPLYALSTLADFGLRAADPGMTEVIEKVLAHQSCQGAFQSLVNVAAAYGGSGKDQWAWAACDAPTLLYALLNFGLEEDERVKKAAGHLGGLVQANGYRCAAAPEMGSFRGPGRRDDPCPIANVYALKALAMLPAYREGQAARLAATMLLDHWEQQKEKKYYLFGVGSDFRKLKYPFVWYDILHVTSVLWRFPFARADRRCQEMLALVTAQANAQGQYTAASMYQAWKGWSFADKKAPSPWLTYLVLRLQS